MVKQVPLNGGTPPPSDRTPRISPELMKQLIERIRQGTITLKRLRWIRGRYTKFSFRFVIICACGWVILVIISTALAAAGLPKIPDGVLEAAAHAVAAIAASFFLMVVAQTALPPPKMPDQDDPPVAPEDPNQDPAHDEDVD